MQVKIGICGAALIANDFVISLKQLDPSHYKVVAVAENSSLDRAKQFAQKLNIPKAYGSFLELAQDPEIDLVYIATLNMYHYSAAKMMIENKKHVLVEKPFTIDPKTTKHLFELGKEHNVFVMEALWTRFLPAYRKVRELIQSGAIGDVTHVSAHAMVSCSADRMLLKKLGGGVSMDLGVYGLNAIFEGVGYIRPTNVKAFGRLSKPNEADMCVSAILDFPDANRVSGCTGTLILTCRASGNGDGLCTEKALDNLQQVIYLGTKGYIKINDWINCPKTIEVNGEKIDVSCKDNQAGYNWPNSYGLCHEFKHLRECLMENKINSPLHGSEQTQLLTDTMRKLCDEVGHNVVDTPITNTFEFI